MGCRGGAAGTEHKCENESNRHITKEPQPLVALYSHQISANEEHEKDNSVWDDDVLVVFGNI